MKIIWMGVLMLIVVSCNRNPESGIIKDKNHKQTLLFEIVNSRRSGIDFGNEIVETPEMNGFNYMNYNNGAGVAVADFNKDGLQDIYFLSTLGNNALYLNKGNMHFEDVSEESGSGQMKGLHTGVTAVDINSDGWTDIYVCLSGPYEEPEMRRNKLLVNQGLNRNGIPTFKEESSKYGLDLDFCSTQAAFFDYDLDGDLDMFLVNNSPDLNALKIENIEVYLHTKSTITADRFFINQDGKYVDISEKAGMVNNSLIMGLGLGVSDLNNDGWPDVYVCTDFLGQDALYLNNQDGTFTESSHQSLKHMTYSSMGNDLADFNNDGWTDIFTNEMMAEDNYTIKISAESMNPAFFHRIADLGLHQQFRYNTLQMNHGVIKDDNIPVFSDIAQIAGMPSTDWSWGPLLFDMDNDGWKDLFVHNGFKADYLNNDFKNYFLKSVMELIKNREIIPIGVLHNPVVFQIMQEMPQRKKNNYFFRNNGDLTFTKMNGVWAEDILTCSNGAAYADLDNDGDLDIVVNNSEGISFIYKNNNREIFKTNFIQFNLNGPGLNPMGIGARIILKQPDQIQVLEQYLTRGFCSSISQVMHFGLGTDTIIPEIKIIWPDGKDQIIKNVRANQRIDLHYRDASGRHDYSYAKPSLFTDVSGSMIHHRHMESIYDDFVRESQLPHRLSDLGPAMSVSDVNHDGLEDFYIGGARGYAGQLYIQTKQGFRAAGDQPWSEDIDCEDIQSLFFDADGDGDPDLYVVSGSNEYTSGSPYLQDRLYMNNGSGGFKKTAGTLPDMKESGSRVIAGDYDEDGDLDLFVGGRQIPGKYPLPASSRILRNDSEPGRILFKDVTSEIAPQLNEIGMVTDAVFTDINGNGRLDLVIVGEWMTVRILVNNGGTFQDITDQTGLSQETGWWNCVVAADFDHDGDIDLVAGNLGLNSRYKADKKYPFELFAKDFDNNGTLDLVLGHYYDDTLHTVNGRDRAGKQTPFILQKYPTYTDYAMATLEDIYGLENLKSALNYKAFNFATCYFQNNGNGTFRVVPLDILAQVSVVNGILAEDIDGDGNLDLVIAGNKYGVEVESVRSDASIGLYLKGDGKGGFDPVIYRNSGLFIDGDVKGIDMIHLGKNNHRGILVAKNNSYMQLIQINDTE